jgi:archaellum biogenesis protein FlaJ (TadC family)
MDKFTLKQVILKMIERNTFEKLLASKAHELQIADEEKSYLEDEVTVLKTKNLMYEVQIKASERPWWDKYWIGAGSMAVLLALVIALVN